MRLTLPLSTLTALLAFAPAATAQTEVRGSLFTDSTLDNVTVRAENRATSQVGGIFVRGGSQTSANVNAKSDIKDSTIRGRDRAFAVAGGIYATNGSRIRSGVSDDTKLRSSTINADAQGVGQMGGQRYINSSVNAGSVATRADVNDSAILVEGRSFATIGGSRMIESRFQGQVQNQTLARTVVVDVNGFNSSATVGSVASIGGIFTDASQVGLVTRTENSTIRATGENSNSRVGSVTVDNATVNGVVGVNLQANNINVLSSTGGLSLVDGVYVAR